MGRRLGWWGAAATLLLVFVASRARLVTASYDAIANWEEPAFLYAAVDLGERGLVHLFDHQDDLSHGGSIPLVLIATGWVEAFGPRLDVLKGVAIAWSSLTLLSILLVGGRFVSPRYGLLVAAMYAGLGASFAALQVTLVGSHPEAVLFCVLALGAYWRALEPGAGTAVSFALGAAAALAVWCSYFSAAWMLPLLAFHLARRRGALAAVMLGALAGLSPWLVQNIYLRPHGAMQWLERAAHHRALASADDVGLLRRAVESLGLGTFAGALVVGALMVLGAVAALRAAGRRPAVDAQKVMPLTCAVVLGLAMIAVIRPQAVPAEGYYYARFFAPLMAASFFLAAFAIEATAPHTRTPAFAVATSAVLLLWWLGQRPLYAGTNTYVADRERDLAAGCAVFGHAEVDRCADFEDAVEQLGEIAPPECRSAAFSGYGWGVVSRYARDGDVSALQAAFDAIGEPRAHAAACSQARRLMATMYEQAMTSDRRRTGMLYLDAACRAAAADESAAR